MSHLRTAAFTLMAGLMLAVLGPGVPGLRSIEAAGSAPTRGVPPSSATHLSSSPPVTLPRLPRRSTSRARRGAARGRTGGGLARTGLELPVELLVAMALLCLGSGARTLSRR